MYLIEIKENAMEVNRAVRELVDDRGRIIEVESRGEADELATSLSDRGERVRVQNAAPQETKDIDGYLIHFPRRFYAEPKESKKRGLTFDVGGNVYGELGRAVVIGNYGVSPGVRYYFAEELGYDQETYWLRRIFNPYLPDNDIDVSWSPDCLIRVYSREVYEVVEEYYCEIKSGQASFQRGQLEDMKEVAKTLNVLKIRVDVEELPDEYTLRISMVESK